MSQIVSQQSQAANAATNLQQGQDTVVSALQQRFNDQSGVNIDTEMSNLIALQNAYGANARVMSHSPADDVDAAAIGDLMSITGPGSITAANLAAQTNMFNQLNTLSQQLGTGRSVANLFRAWIASRRGCVIGLAAFGDQRLQHDRHDGRHDADAGAIGTDPARQCQQFGAASGQSAELRFRSTTTGRRRPSNRPQAISIRFFRCSIPRSATITCSRAAR